MADEAEKGLTVPWRTVSAVLMVTTVALVSALAVVVRRQDADTLATVALSLAVVAFGAQLLIFVADAQAARQQAAESQRVNADTRELLAEIRTTTAGLMATLSGQFDRVLRAALGETISEVVTEARSEKREVDPADIEARLMERVEAVLQRERWPLPTPHQHEILHRHEAPTASGAELIGNLASGTRVHHRKFGAGTVTAVLGEGEKTEVHVKFDNLPEGNDDKILLLSWAPLRRL